jgi:Asp/Glu/hydantoin racemase
MCIRDSIKALFKKYIPEAEMINIIDDSLLEEALINKGVTPQARRRYLQYALAAQEQGAEVILNQCSSYSECADWAGQALNIPILKIDGPMAKQATELGKKIAVVITAVSSLETSCRLVESYGDHDTVVTPCFVTGAYEALLVDGDKAKHDALVVAAVEKAAESNEVIVMAQGSMVRLLPQMVHIKKPILTSMESGVAQLRPALGLK